MTQRSLRGYSQTFNRKESQQFAVRYILHPGTTLSMVIDVCSMVLMANDVLLVPFTLAWQLPTQGVLLYIAWVTVLFWTLDMFLSFFKSPQGPEKAVLLTSVARRYLFTWFPFDLFLVTLDWTTIALELSTGGGQSRSTTYSIRMIRVLRIARLARAARLLYAERLSRVLERIDQHLWSKTFAMGKMRIAMSIMNLLLIGMVVNHWCACVWFAIALHAPDDSTSWLVEFHALDHSIFYQYVVSFQWAVAHMLGGSPVVEPQNSIEFLVATMDLVIGVLFGSVLISTVASMMIELHMARKMVVEQMTNVKFFLLYHGVESALSLRVLKQCKERLKARQRPTIKTVPVLSGLSPALLAELRYELFATDILRRDFLCLCSHISDDWLKDLCRNCIEHTTMAPQDELFCPDQVAASAHVLTTGAMKYDQQVTQTLVGDTVKVDVGDWLSEQALWVHWKHRGWAEAVTQVELLSISVAGFVKALGTCNEVKVLAESFAHAILGRLATLPPKHLTDLPMEQDEVLLALPREARTVFSQLVMDVMACTQKNPLTLWQRRKGRAELQAEVEQGACVLKVNHAGQFTRVIHIAVLELRRADGKQLIMMGELDTHGRPPRVRCEPPATKVLENETPDDAVRRLLSGKLSLLASGVRLQGTEVQIVGSNSISSGLYTRYVRTVFSATLDQDLKVPPQAEMRCSTFGPPLFPAASVMVGTASMKLFQPKPSESEAWDARHQHQALELCRRSSSDEISVYAWLSADELQDACVRKLGVGWWLSNLSTEEEEDDDGESWLHDDGGEIRQV